MLRRLGGDKAFLVQNIGNVPAIVAGFVKLLHARNQFRIATERGDPRDRSDHLVHRLIAAMPMTGDLHMLGVINDLDDNRRCCTDAVGSLSRRLCN